MSDTAESIKEGDQLKKMEVDVDTSSDSEDADEETKLESRAQELEKQITEYSFSYDAHVELVGIYKKLMNLTQMRAAYERFRKVYPLTPALWLDWLRDEMRVACSESEKNYILDLFEQAVKDYLSVDLWLEYVQYSIGNNDGEKTRKIFENSVNHAGLHVSKGSLLWDAYREFELAHLSCIADTNSEQWEVQAKRVADVFRRQLSVTLLDMERTYIEWRVWCERLPKNDFINKEQGEWSYKDASKYMDDYKDYEDKLLTDEDKLSVYRDYIKYERKPEIIRSLYERAVTDCSLDADIWMEFCTYFYKLGNFESCVETVERALRNCPWNANLWIFQMRAFELSHKTHDDITNSFEKSLSSVYQSSYDYLQLWLAYLEYYRRFTNFDDNNSVEKLRAVFQKGFEHLNKNFGADGDPECTLLRFWAKLEAKVLKNMQEARKIWNDYGILKTHGTLANFWIELIDLERHYGDDKHVQRTYQRALSFTKDWPQCIVQSWVVYERECGTAESMINCMNTCSKYITKFGKEAVENSGNQSQENEYNRKRKHDNEKPYHKVKHGKVQKEPKKTEIKDQEMTADTQEKEHIKEEKQFERIELNNEKENRSLFISNLDYSVTEDELKQFIGQIEEMRLVTDRKGNSKGYAYAVFPTQEEAQKVLARDREKLSGRPIFISKCKADKMNRDHQFKYSTETEKHKLFVRGLPMTMNEEEVSEIFKPYGKLKEIRLVTYRNGRSKGLAYVEYENASDASNAIIGTDNKEVRGFTISVAISAPPKRKIEEKSSVEPKPEVRHSKSRIQLPLVPRSVQVAQNKPAVPTLTNDDFRKMLLSEK